MEGMTEKLNMLLYADDLALIADSDENLQKLLEVLYQWCEDNDMSINSDKTKVIHFCNGIWYNMVWYDGMVSKYGIKSHTILHTIPSYHTKIIINPYLELISCILPAFTKPLNQEIIIRNERTTLSVS